MEEMPLRKDVLSPDCNRKHNLSFSIFQYIHKQIESYISVVTSG